MVAARNARQYSNPFPPPVNLANQILELAPLPHALVRYALIFLQQSDPRIKIRTNKQDNTSYNN